MKPHSKYIRDLVKVYGPKGTKEIAAHFGWCVGSTAKRIQRAMMDGAIVIADWKPRTYGIRTEVTAHVAKVRSTRKPQPAKVDFSIASYWRNR